MSNLRSVSQVDQHIAPQPATTRLGPAASMPAARPASASAPHTAKSERPLRVRRTVQVDGVDFDALTVEGVVNVVRDGWNAGRGGLIVTPNVDILRQLRRSDAYDITQAAEIVTPDGMPVVWASRVQGSPLPERVTGVDLVEKLCEQAAADTRRVFFLGAAPGVAERAAGQLQQKYPRLVVAGTSSPPKGFDEDPGQLRSLSERLAVTQPDVVFTAFGFPKQERLAMRLMDDHPKSWFLGCGGAFDMISGDRARAPKAMQKAGTEWVHRMVLEPRRLGSRYLKHDVPYVAKMMGGALRRRGQE